MDNSVTPNSNEISKHRPISCPGCKASSHTTERKGELEIQRYVTDRSKMCLKCDEMQCELLEFKRGKTRRGHRSRNTSFISEMHYRCVCPHIKRSKRWKRLSAQAQRLHCNRYSFDTCVKNREHKEFVPAHAFHMQSLPEYARDEDIYQCIKEMIPLTVKLEVSKPDGKKLDTVGSGSLYISESPNDLDFCPCCECSKPGSEPVKAFRIIRVTTALHVVKGKHEAKLTKVYIDFDDDEKGDNANFLTVFKIFKKDKDADRSILECATHDLDLYQRILDIRSRVRVLEQRLKSRYSKNSMNLAVVISHPHGMGKRVSFGQVKEKFIDVEREELTGCRRTSFSHNVPTCSGSSGAVLWILGFERVGYMDNGITDHTHSMGDKGNLNTTGEGSERDFPEIHDIIVHNHKCPVRTCVDSKYIL